MNKFLIRFFKKALLLSLALVAISLPFIQRMLGLTTEKGKDGSNGIAIAHADVVGTSGSGTSDSGCGCCDVGCCGDC
jgi:hypothetical protein